ncbi:MAG TPA: hypothetical protein VFR31_08775, partial [Thermoanaerobaculia bacterium]|nr:hypothetical protein [Thermoanaerobaculia bacterium]
MAVLSVFVVAIAVALPASAAPPPKPTIRIEAVPGGHQISVEVPGAGRIPLRLAPGLALPGATGWDPAGRAAFVTW